MSLSLLTQLKLKAFAPFKTRGFPFVDNSPSQTAIFFSHLNRRELSQRGEYNLSP